MRQMASGPRREERTAVQARFSARDASGAGTLVFLSHDVSSGGAFLKSDLLLEQGEVLDLAFDVPGAGELEVQAKVAWVRRFPEAGQVPGMGVQFQSLSDEDSAALLRWLKR
jgi:uncharacterized protein (TIGR02266 family)